VGGVWPSGLFVWLAVGKSNHFNTC